ncbi:hypothetical protein HGR00_10160 [Ralstonia insidiosa]|uniref:Uncharacterized protein n=1 Tax=Ralstonia insidiosa TaxID=190721 RepID=A0A848P3Q1_9RALS|nr:hypothetical protein [Ralstonia insidiosa]
MAQCVVIQNGAMSFTTDPPQSCSGYLLLQPSEYSNVMALSGAFTYPSASDFAAAFTAGFQWPVFFFIVAMLVSKVASFFDRD